MPKPKQSSILSSCVCALSCKTQVIDSLKRGYQAMVFVHSRKDTGKTARTLADLAGKQL
jgi:replicative superfamily II helicase